MPINLFDSTISYALNLVAHKFKHFDESIVVLSNCQMLKGGIVITALWWVWFADWDNQKERRVCSHNISINRQLCGHVYS